MSEDKSDKMIIKMNQHGWDRLHSHSISKFSSEMWEHGIQEPR